MDFLEDLEMYNQAMDNAYNIITKRKTLDDIYYALDNEEVDKFFLPFDPIIEDGRSEDIIDMVIEYFITTEEYEKCEELTKIRSKCSPTQID
tara:strand:- start:983 stop:1258 length:276 start_codon:yes stop_codon:yes gene_type:complete